MSDERARYALRQALTRALGPDEAATLMEQLPPVPWDQLATKRDLKHDLQLVEHRLIAEMRHLVIEQNRLLFFSMLGAIFTTATLAFAAARF